MSNAGMWMWADGNGENTLLSQELFERVHLALYSDDTTHRKRVAQELLDATPPHWSDPTDPGGAHGGTVAGEQDRVGMEEVRQE